MMNAKLEQSHILTASDVLASLDSSADGLSEAVIERRRLEFGPNLLPEKGPKPLWRIFLGQFASPLIYILVAAGVVSIFVGDSQDAFFIGVVLVINASIGAYQEWQAEKSSLALKKLLTIRARVIREGISQEVEGRDLVPGDIVLLESGNKVPADLRLISSQGLEIDESLLTGESVAIRKNPEWLGGGNEIPAERLNLAYAGSSVQRGRGKGVVIATAKHTLLGQMAVDLAGDDEGAPPLVERMEKFTNRLAIVTLIAAVIIGSLGILIHGNTILDSFFFVVALAVSAIPEGLPVAMTVALAVATTRMAKRKVIVRRLAAVEGLGSCTMIATDKTGTLTCNAMTVQEVIDSNQTVWRASGEGYIPEGELSSRQFKFEKHKNEELSRLALAMVLCNEAELRKQNDEWTWSGDSVDIALLTLAAKAGFVQADVVSHYQLVEQIPFESENQFSAVCYDSPHGRFVVAKGAPEKILDMCRELTVSERSSWERISQDLASRGFRVLAIGLENFSNIGVGIPIENILHQLKFGGLVGMIDPLRQEAVSAIAKCKQAGVDVKMLTGDHRITAFAISKQLGLAESEDQVLLGSELEKTAPSQLPELLSRTKVFARVTPKQKLQIVEAARRANHFVAVTGDGANDAPALRAANIGVAMGKGGTDIARESADLVISDDNFGSIVNGIEEGRVAYANIRKVIFLLVSMGTAELIMVMLAVLSGIPVPLLPAQLLWLNLVTDGALGVAMAFEPGEGDSLRKKPRPPNEPVFDSLMIQRVLLASGVVGVGGFLAFYGALWFRDPETTIHQQLPFARNFLLLVMVMFELIHVGNCRSETRSAFAFSPLRNPVLLFATIAAFLIHLVGMYLPALQRVLDTQPVGIDLWVYAIAIGILIVPTIEIHKWIIAKRRSKSERN